jgi:hypothetical protein
VAGAPGLSRSMRECPCMLPWLCCFLCLRMQFGNPHSRTHMYGWESENAVEKARQQVRQRAAAGRGAASTACRLCVLGWRCARVQQLSAVARALAVLLGLGSMTSVGVCQQHCNIAYCASVRCSCTGHGATQQHCEQHQLCKLCLSVHDVSVSAVPLAFYSLHPS